MKAVAPYFRQWIRAWPLRLAELLMLRGQEVWWAGYGRRRLPLWIFLAEALVRILELLGIGLLIQVLDQVLFGKGRRALNAMELAFAKTSFAERLLNAVRIEQKSTGIAARKNIAFVQGYLIRCARPMDTPTLMHELVHVAQFERWGWAYVVKALASQQLDGYHYDRQHLQAWKRPKGEGWLSESSSLNAEQEAARLEDLMCLQLGLASRWARDEQPGMMA